MTTKPGNLEEELEKTSKVADMLCSGHSHLRDRYLNRALILDLSIIGVSTWLVALSFVDPAMNILLTPFALDSRIWIGVLGTIVFFLSIVQLKTDWKGRADAHRRTADIYAEVKREAKYLLSTATVDNADMRRILAKYDLATAVGVGMPESEFLAQKQRHRTKIAISRYLDQHPFASLTFLRIRFWFRDNF